MSASDLRVDAEINFNPNKFQQGLGKVNTSLDKTATAGKKAFSDVGRAAGAAVPPLQNFKQQADRVATSTTKMGTSAKESTLAMVGLTQQATGAISTFQGLEKQLVAIDKIELDVAKTTEDLARKQRTLNELLEAEERDLQAINDLEKDIVFQREDLRIKTEELNAEQQAYQLNMVNFGLQVVSTGFFGIQALTAVTKLDTFAKIAATAATHGFTAANIKAAFSLGGLRAAMTAVSTHPLVTIALVAATAAIGAYETNFLGLRDTLGGLIGVELPTISQAMTDLGTSIMPEASAQTSNLDQQLAMLQMTTADTTEAVTGYDLILGQTTKDTDELDKSTGKLGKNMKNVPDWYSQATKSVKVYNAALEEAKRKQDELFSKAGQSILDFKKKAKVDRSSTNRILSGQGGFFITEDGRAIAADVDRGANISGSIERETGGLLSSLLRVKKQSRLGDSSLGRRVKLGKNTIGGRSFNSKGRDRNPFGRNDKLSVKLDKRFKKEYSPDRQRFMSILGFPFTYQFPRFSTNASLSRDERRNKIVRSVEQQLKEKTDGANRKLDSILQKLGLTNSDVSRTMLEKAGSMQELLSILDEIAEGKRIRTEVTAAATQFGRTDLIEQSIREFKDFGSGVEAVKFTGRSLSIQKNKDKLTPESLERFLLHGPDKGINARILADQLSFMNVERFAAVGT